MASAIFLYAVYWGLVVRRGMAVRLYRNQALGMSLVSLGLFTILIVNVISQFSGAPVLASSSSFLFRADLSGLLIFFWVDSSMRAGQDTDPLSRDPLRWSKLRYVLWGLIIAGMGVFVGFLALTGDYRFFDSPPPGLASGIIAGSAGVPFVLPLIVGIVALPVAAVRSKDRSFRRQLQWFALALLPITLGSATGLFGEGFLVTAYCFYRSTRALVPLSRIPMD
jgi:hypothetical protein